MSKEIGGGTLAAAGSAADRLSSEQLLKRFQEVEKLPDAQKAVVQELLDAFLIKSKMQEMMAG